MKIPEAQWYTVQPNAVSGGLQAGNVSDPGAETRQNMQQAVNAAFAWHKRIKESAVDDDLAKVQEWENRSLRDPNEGLFSKHGKNAVFVNGNDGETWQERLPKDREKFISELTKHYDADQIALFNRRLKPLTTSYMGTIGVNTIQQGDAWHSQTNDANIENAYRLAISATGDKERDAAFSRGEEAIRANAALRGWDEAVVKEQIFGRKAAVWDALYQDCYSRGDWNGARRILDTRKAEMDPVKWNNYDDNLKDRMQSFAEYDNGVIQGNAGTAFKGTGKASAAVPQAIRSTVESVASQMGVDAGIMLNMMYVESAKSWNPKAKNPKGSATGLGQFIEATWRGLVHSKEGRQYGLTMDGRTDPRQSAIATAISMRQYERTLKSHGYSANAENMYLCHFLGPGNAKGGAIRFLNALKSNPNLKVEDFFTNQQINANPGYLKRGESIAQVYRRTTAEVNSNKAAQFSQVRSSGAGSGISFEDSPEAARAQFDSQKWLEGMRSNNPYLHQAAMAGFNYGYAGYMAAKQQRENAELKIDRENAATYFQMADDLLADSRQSGVAPVYRKSRLQLEGMLKNQGANSETIQAVMSYFDGGGQKSVQTDNKLFSYLATHPEALAETNLWSYRNKLASADFNMLQGKQIKMRETGMVSAVDKATTEDKMSSIASRNGVTWSRLSDSQRSAAARLYHEEYARLYKRSNGNISPSDEMELGQRVFGEVTINNGGIFGWGSTKRGYDMDGDDMYEYAMQREKNNWTNVWNGLGLPSETVLKRGPTNNAEREQVRLYNKLRDYALQTKSEDALTYTDIVRAYYNLVAEERIAKRLY